MKQLKAIQKQLCFVLCKIHLVDKCLLILMLVLLAQSAYILVTNSGGQTEANHIDIIIRTSSASIFGYFLSANFVQRNVDTQPEGKSLSQSKPRTTQETQRSDAPQNRIGFALDDASPAQQQLGNADVSQLSDREETVLECSRLQILTATGIALFCLMALILVRDAAGGDQVANPSTLAVVSQFRDFVSSCVGFLIGCPTPKGVRK